MGETDPHIHVDRQVLRAGADFRNVLASMLGRAPDAPGTVTTGCGIRAPYAMTSPHPGSVTCLACREHAHRELIRFADLVERLDGMPGSPFTGAQAAQAARWARDRAREFAG
ncbi:hypothetical protein E1267_29290 [Nonomuraea longispora]|uniref:Uncharacterized protein n=1 Tax=Nonomuraea longispora TaxID=1848320 RepID=A0A4R4N1K9_9ACTN|nr:hypothetical protein [Nonomuraea longispora]TDC02465.1 hypothetical protein E1267_29290 [Nonomuraea longispora]